MRSTLFRLGGAALLLLAAGTPANAQWVVYDPTNYAQAITAYTQAVQQYEFFLRQALRLPAEAVRRYRIPDTPWASHDEPLPMLGGLNTGLNVLQAYRDSVNALESLADVRSGAPAALQGRLGTRYGAIQLADSIARLGIQQAGTVRGNGPAVLRAIQAMDDDASAGADAYQSQTAILNKINAASVLGLRIAEQGTQFLAHTVEQLLIENLRKREAEAELMNAHGYQWQYGARYGAEMFDKTAERLDGWHQP
jgi:hypothetical protein